MTDVLLLFGADKRAAATRLGEAVEAAGYAVELRQIADPEQLASAVAEAPAAGAALLVWSRLLVSAVLAGGLDTIRAQRNLIEVSIDGITPPSRLDPARVVLLSGWRGQPFHPGWQKVEAELRRLCTASAPPAAPRRPDPERRSARTRRGLAPASLGVTAAAALALMTLAWWTGREPTARPTPPAEQQSPPRVAAIPTPAPPPPAPKPLADGPKPAEVAADLTAPPADAAVPAAETADIQRGAHDADAAPVRRAAPPRSRTVERKKYSARNSKTMRLFCAGAGRGTPQCQVFVRSTRD